MSLNLPKSPPSEEKKILQLYRKKKFLAVCSEILIKCCNRLRVKKSEMFFEGFLTLAQKPI
jgi:hypothetical protein